MRTNIRKIGPANVTAVGSDSASTMYASWALLVQEEEFGHIAWAPCGGHMGGRIVADVFFVYPEVQKQAKEDNFVAAVLRRKKLLGNRAQEFILKARREGAVRKGRLKVKRARATRFCTYHKTMESVQCLLAPLKDWMFCLSACGSPLLRGCCIVCLC
jgi:hypothetical protein